jgi:hypothetical protein
VLAKAPPKIHYVEHFEMDDGEAVYRHACKLKLEGIVSKRRDSPYRSGRQEIWLKLKCTKSDTFPIVAFVEKLGARPRKIASLYVGRRDGDRLIYAGKARSGYTEAVAREVRERLDPLIIKRGRSRRKGENDSAAARARDILFGAGRHLVDPSLRIRLGEPGVGGGEAHEMHDRPAACRDDLRWSAGCGPLLRGANNWNPAASCELKRSHLEIRRETSHASSSGRCRPGSFRYDAKPCGLLHYSGADHETMQNC